MNTETLKINIVQQILNLSDDNLLQQIEGLLSSETVVGYEADGTTITKTQYLKDMEVVDNQIKAETLKTYSTEEVRHQIFSKK